MAYPNCYDGIKMKTYSIKPSEIDKRWVIIDADGLVLGRLAAIVAQYLRGKHKPSFSPHMDMGDNVIIVNARKIQLSGNKRTKPNYWHTGYPGGIKSRTTGQILSGKYPERVIFRAVQRMLPSNRLRQKLMNNLRVYAVADHPHEAQSPTILEVKSMNKKNIRG